MHCIDGHWVESGSGPLLSLNPATGQSIWQGQAAGADEVAGAVAAARRAFPAWASLTLADRFAVLERFKALVERDAEALTMAIAQETGKPLWDARTEVAAVIGKLAFAREAYAARTGASHRPGPAGTAVLDHRPHGVMAVYGPYNFPAHLPNGHIMPALLAGNSVVFKPSEQTPMVGEWVARRWQEAGLPPGVLNLVQGERKTGILLAEQPIDGLLFTGSTATGLALHKQFGGRPEVMLALEMGGNNPLIVGAVQNLRAAVHETILSAFISSGQRCTCARRLIVDESWGQSGQFIDLLIQSTIAIAVGPYSDRPEPFMGPLISNREAERLMTAMDRLVGLGGNALLPMQRPDGNRPFVTPGIVDMTGVKNIPDEEYFGPLLQLYRVPSAGQAVTVANQTRFGLSGAILCDDRALYQELRSKTRSGLWNWNRPTTGASGAAPFGGTGISGNHRPAGYYAADYCAYPMASMEGGALRLPEQLSPGLTIA